MRADYPMNQENKMNDPINPNHYTERGKGIIECVDYAGQMGFFQGNAFKYAWRAGDKGDLIEDLKKALWYLNRCSHREAELKPLEIKTLSNVVKDADHPERVRVLHYIASGACLMAERSVKQWIQDATPTP